MAIGDTMFMRMQDFDFAQILSNLSKKIMLGDAAAYPAPTTL